MNEERVQAPEELLAEIRNAFERRDWSETLAQHERLLELPGGAARASRLEAACLAARAHAALKQRPAARALLKPFAAGEYRKPVHYEFLALAFLDLKQYGEVARACERAAILHDQEAP